MLETLQIIDSQIQRVCTQHPEITRELLADIFEDEKNGPQLLFWVDLVRTNLMSYHGIPVSKESSQRAVDYQVKISLYLLLIGSFEKHWENRRQSDWMATMYENCYGDVGFTLAKKACEKSLKDLSV